MGYNRNEFEEVSKLFYRQNFGSASKADIELLMFHLFMEQKRDNNEAQTDYCISKELGITQQRVRNLKIKEQLKYPRIIDWEKELCELLKKARYDDPNIVIDVPDPNVLIEIKNYLEENGMYVNTQLNSRLLSMRIEFFVDLALETDDSKNRDEVYKSLIKELKKNNKYEDGKLQPNLNKCKDFVDVGVNIVDIVVSLVSLASPNNLILLSLKNLLSR